MSRTSSAPAMLESLEPRLMLSAAFLQEVGGDGIACFEAENYHTNIARSNYSWDSVTSPSGYVGSEAMKAAPDDDSGNFNSDYVTNSPQLDFEVNFAQTGTHYVWLRGFAETSGDDSAHVGLDGQAVSTADRISGGSSDPGFVWINDTMDGTVATIDVPSTGLHTLNLWMREDGFVVDRLLVTTNAAYQPSGDGPAESQRDTSSELSITNLSASSGHTYTVVDDGLDVNAQNVFTDRSYKFSQVPSSLVGETYIQTANDDKTDSGLTVSFDINQDSTVYVAHDDRFTTRPSWLSDWTDTGETLVVNDGGSSGASLFKKDFIAGTVQLGANLVSGEGNNMYNIIVVPTSAPTDTTAPSTMALNVGTVTHDSVELTWQAPGDDGTTGTAESYDIRYSTSEITESNWASATTVTGEPTPSVSGTGETYTVTGLDAQTTYYFAIKATDDAGNISAISNSPSETTLEETLETVKINFQQASSATPSGYIADTGVAYTSQNGNTYGWSSDNTSGTRDRGVASDQRYDTLNHFNGNSWEFALADGTYTVYVVCGDAAYTNQINTLDVEGIIVTDPDGQDHHDEYTFDVTVTDGKLTIAQAAEGSNAKINFIEITGDVGGGPENAAPVATGESYTATEDTLLSIASPGVLSNDTDADEDALTAHLVTDAAYGSVTLNSNGSFSYTPNAGYVGADSFVYKAFDGTDYSQDTTVCLNVEAAHENLLTNSGFEAGDLSGWYIDRGTVGVVSSDAHEGNYAAKITGDGKFRQKISTTPGQRYKVTAWLKILSEQGDDWGGLLVGAFDDSWQNLDDTGGLRITDVGSDWFEIGLNFTATTEHTRVQFETWAGDKLSMDVLVDEVVMFHKTTNKLPIIESVDVTPTLVNGVPTTQNFSVTADDPDGAVHRIVWDFGDGARAYGESGSRSVGLVGEFTGTVYIVDDEYDIASQSFTWSADDVDYPDLSIDALASDVVSTDSITLTGSAAGTGLELLATSDRDESATVTGTTTWSSTLKLHPGNNRLMVQARNDAGLIVSEEVTVRYEPSGSLGISNVTHASSVEKWKTLEVSFELDNSAATHPQFPYNATPAPGLEWIDGVTVDGVFWLDSDPNTVYRRPAFLYQDYNRSFDAELEGQRLVPNGDPVWKVRFAPPTEGNWTFRIEATEAGGTASTGEMSFAADAVSDPDNHGPIGVSENDWRYFEYADGTPFLGSGVNYNFTRGNATYDADDFLTMVGDDVELVRTWLGGKIWGGSWPSFQQRKMGYDGNTPQSGMTIDNAYGDGLGAIELDATEWALDDNDEPLYRKRTVLSTDNKNYAPTEIGKTYVLRVRWRTEGVGGAIDATRDYGATVKVGGYIYEGNPLCDMECVIPHITGTTPWHVAEYEFQADHTWFPHMETGNAYVHVALENCADGKVFIDAITVQEVQADGTLGPNLMDDAKANLHTEFDAEEAWGLDYIIEQSEQAGVHYRFVLEEKEDWSLNHIGRDGLPDPTGNEFFNFGNYATQDLHEYYWRYMMGRYGASRAVHSWEFVNEGEAGLANMYRHANRIGQLAEETGNPHIAGTSSWSGIDEDEYNDALDPVFSDIEAADFHTYVLGTGWLDTNLTDAVEMHDDSASFFRRYDTHIYDLQLGKPTIAGEIGIDGGGDENWGEDEDGYPGYDRATHPMARDPYPLADNQWPDGTKKKWIHLDENSIWMHKMMWARTGHGGVVPLFWYYRNTAENNLWDNLGNWNDFMAGEPINNGNYEDAAASVSEATDIRAWGQKDMPNGKALLWIDHADHTWYEVAWIKNGRADNIGMTSGNVSISMCRPDANFTLEWWDTYSGTITSTETVTADSNGVVTLQVSDLATDKAAKLIALDGQYVPQEDLTVSNVSVSTGESYVVLDAGAAEGVQAYTDRDYTISTLDSSLAGTTFIRTANDDKSTLESTSNHLSFDVNVDVTVYVAHDDRYANKPDWLESGWTDTGMDIDLSAGQTLSVYSRTYSAGTIELGGNEDSSEREGNGMYMVFLEPQA